MTRRSTLDRLSQESPSPRSTEITNNAKHTDEGPTDTIPSDLKRDYEDAMGGSHFSYGNYHVARIIERTGRAETRIEVLEAALRDVLDLFPSTEILRAITPDEAMEVRLCPLTDTPKVADVLRFRAALAASSGSI